MIRRLSIAFLAVLVGTASLARAQNTTGPVAAPQAASTLSPATPAPAPTLGATPPSEPSPSATAAPVPAPAATTRVLPSGTFPFPLTLPAAQTYATFVKTTTSHQDGVIDILRKDDELYFDLRPENFDKTYIVEPSIERGVGGEAFAGRVYEPFQVTFKLVGKRVLWITPNTRYVADKGSAAANSLAISVADSVILSTPIVAEDPAKKHVVVSPSLFLTDFEGIGADLGRGAAAPSLPGLLQLISRPSFSVDATKSYYLSTKAFPRNDEISVNLTFNGPPNALPTVPDGRGIPIGVHYSIVAPPERDPKFVPRLADDRVGLLHHGAQAVRQRPSRFAVRALHRALEPRQRTDHVLFDERDPGGIPCHRTARHPRVERYVRKGRASERDRGEGSAVRTRLGPRRRALHERSLDHVRPARTSARTART